MGKVVTKIEAKPAQNPLYIKKKRNTAAYTRVSTDEEEQQNSFAAQADYYTREIQANPDWNFVGIYCDEGITGTNTKKRDGFNQMVADALAGKIDLVVTKSISRFARNTVDSLQTIRLLRDHGVEVWFEEQNIYTMDGTSELLITILSSLAQEEARNISQNVTWGQRRRFEQGKVSMPYGRFLGYEKGEDGNPQIVEEEAQVVRLIYTLFLQGKALNTIARYLTQQGIPTPGGNEKWSVSTVRSILRQEKYKGEAILQKTVGVNFLEKTRKQNEGEAPQFHVTGSHPAIVTAEQFDLVQAELERRAECNGARQSGLHFLSSKLICDCCGSYFGPKTWYSNTKYKRVIWQCNGKYSSKEKCTTPHVTEEQVQTAFVEAFNALLTNKAEILSEHRALMAELLDTSALDKRIAKATADCEEASALIRAAVEENARAALDQAAFQLRYDALAARYTAAKERLDAAEREKRRLELRRARAEAFFSEVEGREGVLAEFDEELWNCTVESVTVLREGGLRVRFKDGAEVLAG
jgi:DNA invertase Pin-like site-specific DNA recombinase